MNIKSRNENDKKELRKLKRAELLELLLTETKRADKLELEIEKLRAELENKKLRIEESGSIAEAALKLSGIFEAAQQAADQYLENVKLKADAAKAAEQQKTPAEDPAETETEASEETAEAGTEEANTAKEPDTEHVTEKEN